jgi:serine/threonine protein phosphatase PrpC
VHHFRPRKGFVRICIADGHWGNAAAEAVAVYWLYEVDPFPTTHAAAVKLTGQIEEMLYQRFGKPTMDSETDFTPEASFIAVEVREQQAMIVSYGDCRLMVVRNRRPVFNLHMEATWLGAFSRLGLRNRLPVKTGLVFERHFLEAGDRLALFTDGVDECVYEKPTISMTELAKLLGGKNIPTSLEAVLARVAAYGAEDNASLAVYQA